MDTKAGELRVLWHGSGAQSLLPLQENPNGGMVDKYMEQ